MGISITREQFSAEDFRDFSERLQENLRTLKELLRSPEFGQGEPSVGGSPCGPGKPPGPLKTRSQ